MKVWLVAALLLAACNAAVIEDRNARVILNGGEHEALIDSQGKFRLANVPAGPYLLEVVAVGLHFDQIRLDVTAKDGLRRAFVAHLGASSDDVGPSLPLPLTLEPRGKLEYFHKRQGFSVWGLLTNPMLLSALVPIGLMFGMQKMMSNMDPETMREAQAAQAQMMSSLTGAAPKKAVAQ